MHRSLINSEIEKNNTVEGAKLSVYILKDTIINLWMISGQGTDISPVYLRKRISFLKKLIDIFIKNLIFEFRCLSRFNYVFFRGKSMQKIYSLFIILSIYAMILTLVIFNSNRPQNITGITENLIVFRDQFFNINVIACDPDIDPECG